MTALTDDLLRRRLADRAARAPAISLAAIARSVSAEPRRRSPSVGFRAAVTAPIAAALVIAIAVGGGLLTRGSPPAGTPGAASAVPATGSSASGPPPTPAAVTETVTAWAGLNWEETSADVFVSDETIVNDAIAVGAGFVAVGTTLEDGHLIGRVWQSPDGRSWTRTIDPGMGTDNAAIPTLVGARLFAVGDTLVMLGFPETAGGDRSSTLELWSSTDGATWTRGPSVPATASPDDAAAGPAGVMIHAGEVRDRGQATYLVGPALDAWSRTMAWPDGMLLGEPAWARGRWVQPTTTGVDVNGEPSRAVVWTSADAAEWDQVAVDQPDGGMFRVLAAGAGMIGIGTGDDVCLLCRGPATRTTVAWASEDGTAWTRLAWIAAGLPHGIGAQFAADGRRIVVSGPPMNLRLASGDESVDVLQTIDGTNWTPIAMGGGQPGRSHLGGTMVVGRSGVIVLPVRAPDQASGIGAPRTWFGAAFGPATTGVTGCNALGFDAGRCSAVVARAREQAGNPAGVVGVVVLEPDRSGGVTLGGGGAIATVDFTLVGGAHQRVDVRCGLAFGVSSDRVCSDDPQIAVYGGVSTDVPCGATPGGEGHPCATPPPKPRPDSVLRSRPLILPTFDVPLDRVGHYEVLVGTASLPDGMLAERSGTLADPRPTTFWIDGGIQIAVRPGDPCIGARCQQIDSIYIDPITGPQPVHVYLVFDVVELDPGGAILEIRNLIVR